MKKLPAQQDPLHISRKDFIKQFVEGRKRAYRLAVSAGAMELSEVAMGMSSARKEAVAIWNSLIKKQEKNS